MSKTEEILNHYRAFDDALAETQVSLRFGLSEVKVSDIAHQYYCEKAVELDYEQPVEQTEEMRRGEEAHEQIVSLLVPVTKEKAVTEACQERREPTPIYNFGVKWYHNGVPIVGKTDRVFFKSGIVTVVEDQKFSGRLTIYRSYHVQAKVYCLGLDAVGFDTSATKYRICVFQNSCRDCNRLSERSCPILQLDRTEYRCDRGEAIARMYAYEKADAVKDIDWALDYWVGRREATPTKKPNKCRVCNRKDSCSSSLA